MNSFKRWKFNLVGWHGYSRWMYNHVGRQVVIVQLFFFFNCHISFNPIISCSLPDQLKKSSPNVFPIFIKFFSNSDFCNNLQISKALLPTFTNLFSTFNLFYRNFYPNFLFPFKCFGNSKHLRSYTYGCRHELRDFNADGKRRFQETKNLTLRVC